METLIPNLTINAMALSALIGLAVPLALYIILRKKGANHLPFWIGCITFVLFALVLEQLMYAAIAKLPLWLTIQNNIWTYGIAAGFFAGLFEETGRFVAFKTILRKKRSKDVNGLMYGAGHGGIEAVILLSANMIANLIFSLQFNAGAASSLGNSSAAQSLIATPSWMFLVGAVERISAVTIQISFSVLVWFAAKDGKRFWLYPLAILLHLIVDAVAVICLRLGVNVWSIEGVVIVMAVAFVLLAVLVWKKNHKPEAAAPVEEVPVVAEA